MLNNFTDEELLKSDLVITHGLPATGKSSWGRALVLKYPDKVVQVERDEIRLRRFGEEYHTSGYSKRNEKIVTALQNEIIEKAFDDGKTVLSTDSNLDFTKLPTLANKARERGMTFSQKYFDVSVEEAKRRNRSRFESGGHYVPEEDIDKMAAQGYGRDGRIKEFRIGRSTCFAYDRAGSAGEKLVEAWNKKQQLIYPVQGLLLANFDMDGSLVETRGIGDRYMSGKNRNFEAFHKASEFVPAHEDILRDAFRARSEGLTVSVTTARSDEYFEATSRWLENNNAPVSIMKMRKEGDYRPDYSAKLDMIAEFRADGFEIVHSWDDNPSAIAAFVESGVRVTEVPFHTPVDPSEAPSQYPKIEVPSPFDSGVCIRCGKNFQGSGVLGPNCRTK